MAQYDDFITNLSDLSDFLEKQTDLDESLHECAAIAANILDVENCSIMLLKSDENETRFKLRVSAHFGKLPHDAFNEAMKLKEGISGHVAATGKEVLIEDIEKSKFSSLSRSRYSSKSLISVPILINKKVIGVININTPKHRRTFRQEDLKLLNIVALLVGKSIQVFQLQKLMQSQYTIYAIAQENKDELAHIVVSVGQDLDKVAKLLAKTFYREMTKAGFEPDNILEAATEIISLLNENVARHKKRLQRT